MTRRVVVAMSGGVDSSVAAALLVAQGYEVFGVGMRLPEAEEAVAPGRCCGMAGMEDARRVAEVIGIPFYVLDYREGFEREVIAPFCRAYACGQTPNPCVLCNAQLKFGSLLDKALAWGADCLASGHYARIEYEAEGKAALLRGLDYQRDQSYFLYSLSAQRLQHILFPLGNLRKDEVRGIARRLELPVADKPGSQDICFVGPGGYRELLARRQPQAMQSGPITDLAGTVLGQHRGLAAYTVGQRQGLGIAAHEPLYVLALDASRNTVIVGPRHQATTHTLVLTQMHWLLPWPLAEPLKLSVKTRNRGTAAQAEVSAKGDRVLVHYLEPQPLVAPGQAAVFYEGDRVLGGGVVASSAMDGNRRVDG